MRLTIIPDDKAVYVDKVCYTGISMQNVPENVHALQWFDTNGWIEFNDGLSNQEITELPMWANLCIQKWELADYEYKNPAPPLPLTVEENKAIAVGLLSQTDWAVLPDVANHLKSNPYLENVDDFISYRNHVRQIAVNPVAGEVVWPNVPQAVWRKM